MEFLVYKDIQGSIGDLLKLDELSHRDRIVLRAAYLSLINDEKMVSKLRDDLQRAYNLSNGDKNAYRVDKVKVSTDLNVLATDVLSRKVKTGYTIVEGCVY